MELLRTKTFDEVKSMRVREGRTCTYARVSFHSDMVVEM